MVMKNYVLPALMIAMLASCSENKNTAAGPVEISQPNLVEITTADMDMPEPGLMEEEIIQINEPEINATASKADNKTSAKPATVTPRQSTAEIGNGGPVTNDKPELNAPAAEETKEKKGMSHTAKGAIVGAVAGAATGAIVNKKNPVKGAVIGTAVGAGVGAGTGLIVDKSVQKKKEKAAE